MEHNEGLPYESLRFYNNGFEMKLKELLKLCADQALTLQRPDGSFPPGHNGPWNDHDTPVRVTAHYAVLFAKLCQLSISERYCEALRRCFSFLTGKEALPNLAVFHCSQNKSRSNGLIGQAWALEGLIAAGDVLNESAALEIAEKVLAHHRFHHAFGLWYNADIDGRSLDLNRTLNQQIWFAAIASLVVARTGNAKIQSQISHFLENLTRHITIELGNPQHLIYTAGGNHWMNKLSRYLIRMGARLRFTHTTLEELSEGYKTFILAGLARLYETTKAEQIKGPALQILRGFGHGRSDNNPFLWSYNPAGFEMAYATQIFDIDSGAEWVTRQLNRHFDWDTMRLCKNTSDPNTLQARIYEAAVLPDLEMTLSFPETAAHMI